jgi:hypothetical protein
MSDISRSQIRGILLSYKNTLEDQILIMTQAEKIADVKDINPTYGQKVMHVKWAIDECLDMLEDSANSYKVNRWLGFIQGFMWSNDFKTINQLRNETRPK